jgi:NAD(P)-dependent dehydrogenase (short-subunit alcohol dehydrogenase family)
MLGGTANPSDDPGLVDHALPPQTRVMTTTLITGANKGLGYETARRLIEAGHTVWMGARDATRGQQAADALGGTFVELDVTNDESVAAAVKTIGAAGGLDVLVNNAGIAGRHVPVPELTADDALDVFGTNVIGVVRMIHAFAPLLSASSAPTIVNVTSGLGSFHAVHDTDRVESTVIAPLYTASKSAVTMLTVQYAKAFPAMRINAADPGYTATDLNANSGPQTVQEGTDAIVELATRDGQGPTGTFIDRSGVAPF